MVHRQIAEALESAHGDDPSWANILYYHWNKADDSDKTLYYLDKVVEWMMWYSAEYAGARELILRGLDLLQKTDARRLNLLNHLSEGYWRTGQFPEAAQVAEEALQLGLALNVPRGHCPQLRQPRYHLPLAGTVRSGARLPDGKSAPARVDW